MIKAGNHQREFEGLHSHLHEAIQQLNLGISAQQLLNREQDKAAQHQDAAFIIYL